MEEEYNPQNSVMPMYPGSMDPQITNIVGQIDPKTIIDNLDHALKGEQWNKEDYRWELNDSGEAFVNDACRNAIISYITPILVNNTTMANIDEKRLSFLMEAVIDTIPKMFVTNLEKFGFVPEGPGFKNRVYYNRGSPDSSRMSEVTDMVYMVCFLVLTRALKGQESIRIFKSLTLSDNMNYSGMPQEKKTWLGKVFG